MLSSRRLVPFVGLLLVISILLGSGTAGGQMSFLRLGSKISILAGSAKVDRRFHVSIPVRCTGPSGSSCTGSVWLQRHVPPLHRGGSDFLFPINVPRHFQLALGEKRSVRVEIPRYLRRPRGETAGEAWVIAEFANVLGEDGKRPFLLHWPRLLKPRHRGAGR